MGDFSFGAWLGTATSAPPPVLTACSRSSETSESDLAQQNADYLQLSRTDLNAIMAAISSDLSECDLRGIAHRTQLGSTPQQRATNLWLAVASYIVNTKFQGNTQFGSTPVVYLRYDVAHMSGADMAIRDGLTGLSEDQKIAVILELAKKLKHNSDESAPLYYNLTLSQQRSYDQLCDDGTPSGLRFWAMSYAPAAFPQPIILEPVTKEELLAIINQVKSTTSGESPTAGDVVCGTVAGATKCLNTLDKSLRAQVFSAFYPPFLAVCSADPTTAARNGTTTVNLYGAGLGIFEWDAQNKMSFIDGFTIDLGNNVTVTPQLPTIDEYGIFSTLPLSVVVDPNTACTRRTMTITNGTTPLATLENYFRITGCGGRPQCSDGIDNDGDGKIDYPADPDCTSPTGNSEFPRIPDPCAGKTGMMLDGCCQNHLQSPSCPNRPAAPPAPVPTAPAPVPAPALEPEATDPCAGKTGLMHDGCCQNHPSAASCN